MLRRAITTAIGFVLAVNSSSFAGQAAGSGSSSAKFKVQVVPGFPPFDNIDDPAPPDKGEWENNFLAQGARSGDFSEVQAPYWV
jgi:hypothetical protein